MITGLTACPHCGGTGLVGGGPLLGPEFAGGYGPETASDTCEDCKGSGNVLCGYCLEGAATTEIDPECPACEACAEASRD